jgi:hypothetical protein
VRQPGILKDRETDNCKTKTSMKFGYFEVAFHARISALTEVAEFGL